MPPEIRWTAYMDDQLQIAVALTTANIRDHALGQIDSVITDAGRRLNCPEVYRHADERGTSLSKAGSGPPVASPLQRRQPTIVHGRRASVSWDDIQTAK